MTLQQTIDNSLGTSPALVAVGCGSWSFGVRDRLDF